MRRLPDVWYPRLWVGWLAVTAVSFTALETSALKVQPRCHRDSLTQNLQWWLCRTPRRYWLSTGLWLGFTGWFWHHTWHTYPGRHERVSAR